MGYGSGTKLKQTSLVATNIPKGYSAVLIKGVTSFTKDAVGNIIPFHKAILADGEEFVIGETIGLEWRDSEGKKIKASDKRAQESLVRIKKI